MPCCVEEDEDGQDGMVVDFSSTAFRPHWQHMSCNRTPWPRLPAIGSPRLAKPLLPPSTCLSISRQSHPISDLHMYIHVHIRVAPGRRDLLSTTQPRRRLRCAAGSGIANIVGVFIPVPQVSQLSVWDLSWREGVGVIWVMEGKMTNECVSESRRYM